MAWSPRVLDGRWLRREPTARTARPRAVVVALFVGAVALLGYWARQTYARQQRTERALLRGEAMVAGQGYGTRVGLELYNGASAVFRVLNVGRLAAASEAPSDVSEIQRLLDAAADVARCRCAPVLRPAYAFRASLAGDTLRLVALDAFDTAGVALGTDERQWIERAVHARLRSLRGGWDLTVLPELDAAGRALFLTQRPARGTALRVVYGFAVDSAVVREQVLAPLVADPPFLDGEGIALSNHNALALRVSDRNGRLLYRTTASVDGERAARVPLRDIWSGWTVDVSLRPVAAARLLDAALPASPLALLVSLLAAAAVLGGIALFLTWWALDLAALRTDFVSSVTHELRTPLTQILLFAETLEMGRDRSPATRTRAVHVIARETRRLIQLVENVLHVSRIERSVEHDREPTTLAPARLAALVRPTVDAFTPVAALHGATLAVQVRGDAVAAVDGPAFERMLLNLLDNAVRYGPAGQTVTVTIGAERGGAVVTVDDEGPGVAPADRARVWAPYVRLHAAGRRRATGCGIGLTIVRDLVGLHRGRVSIETAPGGGARFRVVLPLVPNVPASGAERREMSRGLGAR